jgi:hypothetical protein
MRLTFKSLGTLWGEFKILSGMISFYVTGGTFIFGSITAYPVVSAWLHQKFIVIPFWQYILAIFVGIALILLVERKVSLPGYYRKSNQLVWNNDNPMKTEIEAIRQENKELKSQLSDIQKMIEGLTK